MRRIERDELAQGRQNVCCTHGMIRELSLFQRYGATYDADRLAHAPRRVLLSTFNCKNMPILMILFRGPSLLYALSSDDIPTKATIALTLVFKIRYSDTYDVRVTVIAN